MQRTILSEKGFFDGLSRDVIKHIAILVGGTHFYRTSQYVLQCCKELKLDNNPSLLAKAIIHKFGRAEACVNLLTSVTAKHHRITGQLALLLRELVRQGADVKHGGTVEFGNHIYEYVSPLVLAADAGEVELVTALLDLGADNACIALSQAAMNGHMHVVAELLSRGGGAAVDVNAAAKYVYWQGIGYHNANLPLVLAASRGHHDVVVQLLNAGARPCESSMNNAASNGRFDIVHTIVERIQPRQKREWLCRAIHGLTGLVRMEVVAVLLAAGASVAGEPFDPLKEAVMDIPLLEMLLSHGARHDGALGYAGRLGQLRAMEILIEVTNPDVQSLSLALLQTTLNTDARTRKQALYLLIGSGADASAPDVLVFIVDQPLPHLHLDVLAIMLEKGGPGIKEQVNEALWHAAYRGSVDMVDMLLAAGADAMAYGSKSLTMAAFGGNPTVVHKLLAAGADPTARESKALITACGLKNAEIVSILIDAGADVKAHGSAALCAAAKCHDRCVAIYKLLLDAGADAGANQSQALVDTIAFPCSHEGVGALREVVRLLVEGGADVNAGMLVAARKDYHDVISDLIHMGADGSAAMAGVDDFDSFNTLLNGGLHEVHISQACMIGSDYQSELLQLFRTCRNTGVPLL